MGLVYDLKTFEKTIGHPISLKRGLVFKSGKRVDEYIQGILRKVDAEKGIIEVEQYLTFLDHMNGEKDTPSKISEFKNTEFELLSILQAG